MQTGGGTNKPAVVQMKRGKPRNKEGNQDVFFISKLLAEASQFWWILCCSWYLCLFAVQLGHWDRGGHFDKNKLLRLLTCFVFSFL